MEQNYKTRSLISILLLPILFPSSLVRSRGLTTCPSPASSPTPPPVSEMSLPPSPNTFRRRNGKDIVGSFRASCNSKCNQCVPCEPVQVLVRAAELKENKYYYPQVWRCMCKDKLFSP